MYYKQIMSLSMKVPSTCFETIFFIPDLVLVFSSHAYLQTYTDMFIICICSLVVLSFFLKKNYKKVMVKCSVLGPWTCSQSFYQTIISLST